MSRYVSIDFLPSFLFISQKKEMSGRIIQIHEEKCPEDGYVLIPSGNALLSRRIRKQTIESGQNVYEVKIGYGRKRSEFVGNYVPQNIYDHVKEMVNDVERRKRVRIENKRNKEKIQVDEIFKQIYPRMPENVRDEIYAHAWEEGTNRVGHAQDLDLSTKVKYATEYHVLHEHTPYQTELDRQSDELYDHLQEELKFATVRDILYEDFHSDKADLMDQLKSEFFSVAKQYIQVNYM